MSTLQVATIKNTGSGYMVFRDSSNTEVGKLGGAWVLFNGENTPAIRDSFNVSSVTDQGQGRFDINLSNGFANSNFAWAGSGGRGNGDANCVCGEQIQHRTSSKIQTLFQDVQNNTRDPSHASCIFFGDQ